MNAATTSILTPETDHLLKARKADDLAGSLLKDITLFVANGDNRKAAQAAAYLLIHLAKKSAQKPFTLLRKANS